MAVHSIIPVLLVLGCVKTLAMHKPEKGRIYGEQGGNNSVWFLL